MIKSALRNYEVKAPCEAIRKEIEQILKQGITKYHGTHHQVDTYFNTTHGQLKIREPKKGTSYLMQYYHSDNPKARSVKMQSQIYDKKSNIKELLTESLGIKVIVVKKRRIYTNNNVTVHIDFVEGLGVYVEIKAEHEDPDVEVRNLRLQCLAYQKHFKVPDEDVTSESYSDLLLKAQVTETITDFQI